MSRDTIAFLSSEHPVPDAPTDARPIELSVVAPAHNEEDNISRLVSEVEDALGPRGLAFEFLIVDDASTDATVERVREMQQGRPWLRLVLLSRPAAGVGGGGGNGQSAAFKAGFARTRGRLVAVLDADLQNDPADLPRMLDLLESSGADFVQGDRSAVRRRGDSFVRQAGSWVGRKFRLWLLGDTITDTGCSLRVMKREIALALPLDFKGMHRFIPVTARHLGATVIEMPVNHRQRHAGVPKYGMGITKRALPGLIDLFAVRWMRSRRRIPTGVREGACASIEAKPDAPEPHRAGVRSPSAASAVEHAR